MVHVTCRCDCTIFAATAMSALLPAKYSTIATIMPPLAPMMNIVQPAVDAKFVIDRLIFIKALNKQTCSEQKEQ